jgi:tetratricopeptide (TPR) repeat protein
VNLGLLIREEDSAGAIAQFREAARLKPGLIQARANLALALLHAGDAAGAVEAYGAAAGLRPDDAALRYNLGLALQRSGDGAGAIQAYGEAIRLRPDYAEAHTNLGNVLREHAHDPTAALAEYHRAVAIDPNLFEARRGMALAHADLGETAAAVAAYREAARIRPQSAEVHYRLGILLDKDDPEQAIVALEEAIRLEPEFAEPRVFLGILLAERGRFRDALPHMRAGHERGAKRADWAFETADALARLQRFADAEERLERVLGGGTTPRDGVELNDFGHVLHAQGRYADAARLWSDALSEDPSLAADLGTFARYNAACSAVRASEAGGADAPGWRARALRWLRDDLAAREAAGATDVLGHWLDDPDLAAVRERVDGLPVGEREDWTRLWADVRRSRVGVASVPGLHR